MHTVLQESGFTKWNGLQNVAMENKCGEHIVEIYFIYYFFISKRSLDGTLGLWMLKANHVVAYFLLYVWKMLK